MLTLGAYYMDLLESILYNLLKIHYIFDIWYTYVGRRKEF